MYKDSSYRSSPQPTPPKATPVTTTAAADNITVVTTTATATITAAELTASTQPSETESASGVVVATSHTTNEPAATGATVSSIAEASAEAASAAHVSISTSSNTPITLSLAAEHLEAEYYQLSCASDCSVSSTSSSSHTSCSGSDDSENSEVYTFRARPAFPAHTLRAIPKRRATLRREHAHSDSQQATPLDVPSRRGSAVSGLSGGSGISGGSSSCRHHKHHKRASISADVRVLRKIGYIASRVRFLAKIYGDFKLVNPYSPAKQRRQLQDILLRHSIPDTERRTAAAASGYRTKRITTAVDASVAVAVSAVVTTTTSATPLARQRSVTPDSSLASSSYGITKTSDDTKTAYEDEQAAQAPRAEEEPTLSSLEDDEEETSATYTAGTVRRKSSVVATGLDETATSKHSLAVLEELLVQFYEQRQHHITVIRRRQHSRRGSQRGNGKITTSNKQLSTQQPQKLIIMSGGSAIAMDSNVGQQLLHTTADIEQQTNLRNANNLCNSSNTADSSSQVTATTQQSSTTAAAAINTPATASSQTQKPPQQQRSYSNAFLQPFSISGCMDRRRRASDCSTHPSSQQLLQQQLLSNQLQVTLKNNNYNAFTAGVGGKFPYHRGSCGGAGEHLLAANSIANRSTIILSKSCSNVEGGPAALHGGVGGGNGDVIRKFSLGGHVDASSNGNMASPALTPSPTQQPQLASTHAASPQQQQQQQPTAGVPGSNGNNEYNIVQLNNTIIQCHFNDEDFRALIKDLKRKVEYTERMNWLCLSKRPMGPPHRKSSLPKHQEVKKRFLEICDTNFSDEVKAALRLPAFDSYEWGDADVIHLMQTMFLELGFIDKFNIPIETLREWLYEVYKHYNEVPFHNFRHCFCVAQMMYAMTRHANLLQRLGDLECLILLVSCICHDLDHPGYNNIYQINARTELALRYNDISPLENHHCSIAFRLLEHPECNIFKNFGRDTFKEIREGIIRCILATDMARHNEILTQFKEITPIFDYSNRAHINLLCMVLIKVADISNEARPMDVAEPWLDRLLQEFFAQSAAEKSEGLPVTPFMDPDKVSKPGSQVRFIGLVLLPLFEALGDLVPEVIELIIIPVRIALDYYRRLNDAQTKSRKSVADTASMAASDNISAASDGGGSTTAVHTSGGHAHSPAAGTNGQAAGASTASTGSATTGTGGGGSGSGGTNSGGSISPQMPRSQSGISVKSRRSIPSQKSASRTSVDEPQCLAAELHDLPEGSESGDSETATEVDVAEKTSKFKVDTEGSSNRSKSSHSTSRKSSREKRPSMIGEMCSSGGGQRIRNSYGNIHGYHSNRCHFSSNRAVSLDQYSTNNRRLSDGLQQVISDSNVFYNRQNRGSLEATASRLGEDLNMNATGVCSGSAGGGGGVTTSIAGVTQSSAQPLNPNNVPNMECSAGMAAHVSGTCANQSCQHHHAHHTYHTHTHLQQQHQQPQPHLQSSSNGNLSPTQLLQPKMQQHCCAAAAAAAAAAANTSNGLGGNGVGGSTVSKSTWKARLKQFSDYFGFSFDKGGKRFGSTRSSPCSARNNNTTGLVGANQAVSGSGASGFDPLLGVSGSGGKPQSICCTISNNLQSPGLRHKSLAAGGGLPTHSELVNAGRLRAYSLDVPCSHTSNPRYSSSSGGGGDSSRKSSRHDGGTTGTGDDNNSNNTLHSSGGGGSEMPTCLPPPIRIGSVDASDTILITTGLPRVITPAQLGEAEPSLSIDLGMASGSSYEPPKI